MKKIFFLVVLLGLALPALAADSPIVVLNTNTLIYHKPDCHWARKCTKNCIMVTKPEAIEAGARPCKVCGG